MSDTAPAPLPGSTPLRIMGFMTGTSLDAVDIAVLDTDGERITAFGPVGDFPLSDPTRAVILEAICAGRSWARGTPEPPVFMAAARAIAMEHFRAGEAFLLAHGMAWRDFDCLGVHGQTVLHERPCRPRPGADRAHSAAPRRAPPRAVERPPRRALLPQRRRRCRRRGRPPRPSLPRRPRPGLGPRAAARGAQHRGRRQRYRAAAR